MGQIGPYEAKSITRDGNIVTIEIDVDNDATLGVLLDVTWNFAERHWRRAASSQEE